MEALQGCIEGQFPEYDFCVFVNELLTISSPVLIAIIIARIVAGSVVVPIPRPDFISGRPVSGRWRWAVIPVSPILIIVPVEAPARVVVIPVPAPSPFNSLSTTV